MDLCPRHRRHRKLWRVAISRSLANAALLPGERGMDSFRAVATDYGICIDGDVVKISRKWTEAMFKFVANPGPEVTMFPGNF